MSSAIRAPWQFEQPLCAEIGPEMYFIDEEMCQSSIDKEYSIARSLCLQCTHLIECRDWAVENEPHGLWGGLTANERKRLRRDRRVLSSAEEVKYAS